MRINKFLDYPNSKKEILFSYILLIGQYRKELAYYKSIDNEAQLATVKLGLGMLVSRLNHYKK